MNVRGYLSQLIHVCNIVVVFKVNFDKYQRETK